MASRQEQKDQYWSYLIHPDKSATAQLTQLCEAIAEVISQLEPGPDKNLTPQRLSAFYRSVGGNDFVFRELRYPGLSLMYKTLGCFHCLQPTENAYDAPSVPCLLVPGFVRWQTVQLLLQPDEQARCIQNAVERYDLPTPNGGFFPKTIPREAFPAKPDEAMEKWQNTVLDRLDDGPKKLKASPYVSPHDPQDRDGYFSRNGNRSRRTSRAPRPDLQDFPPRSSPSHRRSSISAIPSVVSAPEGYDSSSQWTSDQALNASNSTYSRSPRPRVSASHQHPRPPSQSHQHGGSGNANPGSAPESDNSPSKSFNLNFENFHLPFFSSSSGSKKHKKRSSLSPRPKSSRQRSSRHRDAFSSGSEASSEKSRADSLDHHRDGRWQSLAPSDACYPYQRRHSHDAGSRRSSQHPTGDALPRPSPVGAGHPHSATAVPHPRAAPNAQFNEGGYRTSSAPHSPHFPWQPALRVVDPAGAVDDRGRGYGPMDTPGSIQDRRAASGARRSRSDDRRGTGEAWRGREALDDSPRKQGQPLRINTVGGVSGSAGRRIRQTGIKSAVSPSLRRVPPMGLSGGGRR